MCSPPPTICLHCCYEFLYLSRILPQIADQTVAFISDSSLIASQIMHEERQEELQRLQSGFPENEIMHEDIGLGMSRYRKASRTAYFR